MNSTTGHIWRRPRVTVGATARLLSLCALLVLVQSAAALPFLGPEKDFELRFAPGNYQRIKEAITEELLDQKENNATLNQFTSQYKIDRYQADTIRRMLQAEGYYASDITHIRQGGNTIYNVDPGPRYLISELQIEFPDNLPKPSLDLLPVREGAPLRAQDVLDGRSTITDWIYLTLCLYQVQVDYDARVYHQRRTATLTYRLRPTTEVKFGDITVEGLETVERSYMEDRLPVKEGDCFTRRRVDESRLRLLQTNLVASAEAAVGEPLDGQVPVSFRVTERRHRTLRTGVGYDTALGAGVMLGWEHRNLLGRAENLDITLRVNEIGSSLESEFIVPHFRRDNQSLVLNADTFHEEPDAYDSTGASVGAALARQISPELFGSLGVQLRYSRVVEEDAEDEHFLVSLPFTADYDQRDDLLNPRYGWRAAVALEPFTDIEQTDRRFLKSRVTGELFHTVRGWPLQPTFATRISTGTISGVQRGEVPADLRFYVGGGGSVRGYSYQSLGDLSDEDRPVGGRSFTEVALETRLRFSQSWGGVVFLDGGYAYPEELPRFGENLRWGTGFGVRYLTSFAPIRFDVGFPLDRRRGVDDAFQIYISIGQAF